MKKIFVIIVLTSIFLPFSQIQAAGLVPCGGFELDAKGNLITRPLTEPVPAGWKKISDSEMAKLEPVCQFCHFFVLFNNIVKFVLEKIVPSLAVLMIVIGGFLFFFAGQDPAMLNRAKSIFISVAIGLLIIFGAWIVVNTFFAIIGITSWTGEWLKFPGAWFKVNCSAP